MTLNEMLKGLSQAGYVELGYGQVEPNHLSAQRTGQIYAQLPANKDITLLENGQFVKYDYAKNEVNFTGAGEWMLVYNEIKLYRDGQRDCEFAMRRGDYIARIYSPVAQADGLDKATIPTRFYGGKDAEGKPIEQVTVPAANNMYELHYNEDPMHVFGDTKPAPMADVNALVPRVFKTNVGDIYTTNMVKTGTDVTYTAGDVLKLKKTDRNTLELDKDGDIDTVQFVVAKVYTMPDGQAGLKLQRVK